jgi:polyhydroxyalkanoate synthesis regulator phasin
MKENLKEILLMGLGAISLTGEKASELKKELLEKGEVAYKEGTIKNEELKRNIKESLNIEVATVNKDDLVDIINNLSDEEKEEITELLKNKAQEENKDENKEENKDED